MSSAALKQLTQLHWSMYEKAIADARESLGEAGSTIAKYATAFDASLPNQYKIVRARAISQAIDQSKIILFGDFHSHKQCQRALLRVIRTYQNTPDHGTMCLVLEMFRTKDQHILDLWQDGNLSDEELLEQTNYASIWGFPWSNYRPILEYCKDHSIRLYAGNTDNAGKDSLTIRDEHASTLLHELHNKQPSHKIFYLVGEYHLADGHLPKHIKNQSKLLSSTLMRIIVNSDKYFFKLPHDRIHRRDEYLELRPDFFCILNSPPWMKWQSQTLVEELKSMGSSSYIESEMTDELDEDDDDYDFDDEDHDLYTEDFIDLDGYLRSTVDNLMGFLKIKPNQHILDSFKVLVNVDNEDIEHLPNFARVALLEQSARDGVASDYQRRLLLLSEISINNLAYASGIVIFGQMSGLSEDYADPPYLFLCQTLKSIFGNIACKILNPRISLHTRKAIEDYIGATKGKHIGGQRKQRRDIARSTLRFMDWLEDEIATNGVNRNAIKHIPSDIIQMDLRSSHEVSRHLSQVAASSIYKGMIAGKLDPIDLGKWYSKRCRNPLDVIKLVAEIFSHV
jgi:uncharacterized iron-regulated protein